MATYLTIPTPIQSGKASLRRRYPMSPEDQKELERKLAAERHRSRDDRHGHSRSRSRSHSPDQHRSRPRSPGGSRHVDVQTARLKLRHGPAFAIESQTDYAIIFDLRGPPPDAAERLESSKREIRDAVRHAAHAKHASHANHAPPMQRISEESEAGSDGSQQAGRQSAISRDGQHKDRGSCGGAASPPIDTNIDAEGLVRRCLAPERFQVLQTLLRRLAAVGLAYKTRPLHPGAKNSEYAQAIVIFIACPDRVLSREAYRRDILDWIADRAARARQPPEVPADLASSDDHERAKDRADHPDTKTLDGAKKQHQAPSSIDKQRSKRQHHRDRISKPSSSLTTGRHGHRGAIMPAERLRLIYGLLTMPAYQGGVGLAVGPDGQGVAFDAQSALEACLDPSLAPVGFGHVRCVIAMHDPDAVNGMLRTWFMERHGLLLHSDDITQLRNEYGENVAFYFAFLHFYTLALVPLAIVGVLCPIILGRAAYSYVYSAFLLAWAPVTIALWQGQSRRWAEAWGTRRVQSIDGDAERMATQLRPLYRPAGFRCHDDHDGIVPVFEPGWKRAIYSLFVTAPVVLGSAGVLMVLIWGLTISEVILGTYYTGPLASVVTLLPTAAYSLAIPMITQHYRKIAFQLTDRENIRTDSEFENAMTRKIFVFSALVSWLGLSVFGFLVVPFSDRLHDIVSATFHAIPLMGSVKIFSLSGRALEAAGGLSPAQLQSRLVALVVTGQVIDAFSELLMPLMIAYLDRWRQGGFAAMKDVSIQEDGAAVQRPESSTSGADSKAATAGAKDATDEAKECPAASKDEIEKRYVARLRHELAKPPYIIYQDYAEMAVQFGYLTMFSSIWSWAPLICLINNWFEMRSDLLKITKTARRPVPARVEGIGAWASIFVLLGWAGSIMTPAFVSLYRHWMTPDMMATAAATAGSAASSLPILSASAQTTSRLRTLVITVAISEHIYFVWRYMCERWTKGSITEARRRHAERQQHAHLLRRSATSATADHSGPQGLRSLGAFGHAMEHAAARAVERAVEVADRAGPQRRDSLSASDDEHDGDDHTGHEAAADSTVAPTHDRTTMLYTLKQTYLARAGIGMVLRPRGLERSVSASSISSSSSSSSSSLSSASSSVLSSRDPRTRKPSVAQSEMSEPTLLSAPHTPPDSARAHDSRFDSYPSTAVASPRNHVYA